MNKEQAIENIEKYSVTLFVYGVILTFLICELSKNYSTRINVLLIAGAIVVCISMYIYIENKKGLRRLDFLETKDKETEVQ